MLKLASRLSTTTDSFQASIGTRIGSHSRVAARYQRGGAGGGDKKRSFGASFGFGDNARLGLRIDRVEQARRGVASGQRELPLLRELQQLFLGHDLSKLKFCTGGDGADACARIGASSYIFNDCLVMSSMPDFTIQSCDTNDALGVIGGHERDDRSGDRGVPPALSDYEVGPREFPEHRATLDVFGREGDAVDARVPEVSVELGVSRSQIAKFLKRYHYHASLCELVSLIARWLRGDDCKTQPIVIPCGPTVVPEPPAVCAPPSPTLQPPERPEPPQKKSPPPRRRRKRRKKCRPRRCRPLRRQTSKLAHKLLAGGDTTRFDHLKMQVFEAPLDELDKQIEFAEGVLHDYVTPPSTEELVQKLKDAKSEWLGSTLNGLAQIHSGGGAVVLNNLSQRNLQLLAAVYPRVGTVDDAYGTHITAQLHALQRRRNALLDTFVTYNQFIPSANQALAHLSLLHSRIDTVAAKLRVSPAKLPALLCADDGIVAEMHKQATKTGIPADGIVEAKRVAQNANYVARVSNVRVKSRVLRQVVLDSLAEKQFGNMSAAGLKRKELRDQRKKRERWVNLILDVALTVASAVIAPPAFPVLAAQLGLAAAQKFKVDGGDVSGIEECYQYALEKIAHGQAQNYLQMKKDSVLKTRLGDLRTAVVGALGTRNTGVFVEGQSAWRKFGARLNDAGCSTKTDYEAIGILLSQIQNFSDVSQQVFTLGGMEKLSGDPCVPLFDVTPSLATVPTPTGWMQWANSFVTQSIGEQVSDLCFPKKYSGLTEYNHSLEMGVFNNINGHLLAYLEQVSRDHNRFAPVCARANSMTGELNGSRIFEKTG